MKTDLYNAEGYVNAWYDSSNQIIVAKWYKMTTKDHVRPSCEAQLQKAKSAPVKCVVVDTSDAIGTPFPEDQKWFGEYLFPNMQANGVKAIITVLPKNALTKLGTKTWTKTGTQFNMDFLEVASLEDAEKMSASY